MYAKHIAVFFALISLVSCAVIIKEQELAKRVELPTSFFGEAPTSTVDTALNSANNIIFGSQTSRSTTSTSATSVNIVDFYLDFMSNRYSYVNEYMSYLRTHTFSNYGSYTSDVSRLLTYTDNSFTTILSHNSQYSAMLSSVATQFPWYSSWYNAKVASIASATSGSVSVTTVTSTASSSTSSSSAGSSFNSPIVKGNMGILSAQIGVMIAAWAYIFFL